MNSYINNRNIENRIVNHLILSVNSCNNLGLLHGQMGCILTLYDYSTYKEDELYSTIADDFLLGNYSLLPSNLEYGLENGLLGIGWGLSYLIYKGHICSSDDLFEEIDKFVIQKDVTRICDFSIENGLRGLIHYILSRISIAKFGKGVYPFDALFLDSIYSVVIRKLKEECYIVGPEYNLYRKFYEEGINDYKLGLNYFIEGLLMSDIGLTSCPLGIKQGLCGVLLNKIDERYENFICD